MTPVSVVLRVCPVSGIQCSGTCQSVTNFLVSLHTIIIPTWWGSARLISYTNVSIYMMNAKLSTHIPRLINLIAQGA